MWWRGELTRHQAWWRWAQACFHIKEWRQLSWYWSRDSASMMLSLSRSAKGELCLRNLELCDSECRGNDRGCTTFIRRKSTVSSRFLAIWLEITDPYHRASISSPIPRQYCRDWEERYRKEWTHSTRLQADSSWVECDTLADKSERLSGGVRCAFVVTIMDGQSICSR